MIFYCHTFFTIIQPSLTNVKQTFQCWHVYSYFDKFPHQCYWYWYSRHFFSENIFWYFIWKFLGLWIYILKFHWWILGNPIILRYFLPLILGYLKYKYKHLFDQNYNVFPRKVAYSHSSVSCCSFASWPMDRNASIVATMEALSSATDTAGRDRQLL